MKREATPRTPVRGPPTPRPTSLGTTGVAKEKGDNGGYPIILPKGSDEKPNQTHPTEESNRDPSGPQAVGWLKGLEHMDQIYPKAWANTGIRAGIRIPPVISEPHTAASS